MKNVQSGRVLILVKDTLAVSTYRQHFANPIVGILSQNKLVYLTWSQLYSDVFMIDQKMLDNPSTINWTLKDNIDLELVYRDPGVNLPWAKQLPSELLDLSLEFDSELKLAEPNMTKLKSLSPNTNPSYISMLIEVLHPNLQKHYSLDAIYKHEGDVLKSNNVSSNIWTNLRDFN